MQVVTKTAICSYTHQPVPMGTFPVVLVWLGKSPTTKDQLLIQLDQSNVPNIALPYMENMGNYSEKNI